MIESLNNVLENLSSTYVLAITTIIAASIFAFFLGLKNYVEDDEPLANGKPKKKNKPHTFFLPCTLNQECLFEDDEQEASEEEQAAEETDETSNSKSSTKAEQLIKSRLTQDQLKEEQMAQQVQLAEIYSLMNKETEKFGSTSLAEVQEQMKLYR